MFIFNFQWLIISLHFIIYYLSNIFVFRTPNFALLSLKHFIIVVFLFQNQNPASICHIIHDNT